MKEELIPVKRLTQEEYSLAQEEATAEARKEVAWKTSNILNGGVLIFIGWFYYFSSDLELVLHTFLVLKILQPIIIFIQILPIKGDAGEYLLKKNWKEVESVLIDEINRLKKRTTPKEIAEAYNSSLSETDENKMHRVLSIQHPDRQIKVSITCIPESRKEEWSWM